MPLPVAVSQVPLPAKKSWSSAVLLTVKLAAWAGAATPRSAQASSAQESRFRFPIPAKVARFGPPSRAVALIDVANPPQLLARGPWEPGQVTVRWMEKHFEP